MRNQAQKSPVFQFTGGNICQSFVLFILLAVARGRVQPGEAELLAREGGKWPFCGSPTPYC